MDELANMATDAQTEINDATDPRFNQITNPTVPGLPFAWTGATLRTWCVDHPVMIRTGRMVDVHVPSYPAMVRQCEVWFRDLAFSIEDGKIKSACGSFGTQRDGETWWFVAIHAVK